MASTCSLRALRRYAAARATRCYRRLRADARSATLRARAQRRRCCAPQRARALRRAADDAARQRGARASGFGRPPALAACRGRRGGALNGERAVRRAPGDASRAGRRRQPRRASATAAVRRPRARRLGRAPPGPARPRRSCPLCAGLGARAGAPRAPAVLCELQVVAAPPRATPERAAPRPPVAPPDRVDRRRSFGAVGARAPLPTPLGPMLYQASPARPSGRLRRGRRRPSSLPLLLISVPRPFPARTGVDAGPRRRRPWHADADLVERRGGRGRRGCRRGDGSAPAASARRAGRHCCRVVAAATSRAARRREALRGVDVREDAARDLRAARASRPNLPNLGGSSSAARTRRARARPAHLLEGASTRASVEAGARASTNLICGPIACGPAASATAGARGEVGGTAVYRELFARRAGGGRRRGTEARCMA